MSKKTVVIIVVAFVFCFALYNVYSYFQLQEVARVEQEKIAAVRKVAEQQKEAEAQRLREEQKRQAALETERKKQQEEARIAEIEQQKKLEELNKKLEYEKKQAEYARIKRERQEEKERITAERENKKLQSRTNEARTIDYIESVGREVTDAIARSTQLYIRANKQEFLDSLYEARALGSSNVILTRDGANSLMLFAMLSEDTKAIGELIDIGIDVNSKNKMGFTPLMFASAYNTPKVVQYLIDRGANTEDINFMDEGNALHVAARLNPKPEVLDTLLKNGLNLEATAKGGMTPLILAAKFNQNIQVAEHLALSDASISAVDATGSNAYSYAVERLGRKPKLARFKFISDQYNEEVLSLLAF